MDTAPWIIGEPIATDAVGVTYAARHRDGHEELVVRELGSERRFDPQLRAILAHEVKVAAALTHPNVSRTFAYFERDGRSFVASERLYGESLAAHLVRQGADPWPLDAVLRLFRALAEGLAHAHSRGLVHRDFSPESVFLASSGAIKVQDFGIGALTTAPGGSGRTPMYRAPEILQARPPTPAADVFSLGLIGYRLITGQLPHAVNEAGAPTAVAEALVQAYGQPLPPVSYFQPDVLVEIDRLISQMLSVDPRWRPPTGAAVVSALSAPPPAVAPPVGSGSPAPSTVGALLGGASSPRPSSGPIPAGTRSPDAPSWGPPSPSAGAPSDGRAYGGAKRARAVDPEERKAAFKAFAEITVIVAVIVAVVLAAVGLFVALAWVQGTDEAPPVAATPAPPPVPTRPEVKCRLRRNLVAYPSFEDMTMPAWGLPKQYGKWVGDGTAIVGTPAPRTGHSMLEFRSTAPGFRGGDGKASQMFQIIDVRKWRASIVRGKAKLAVTAAFNRTDLRDNRMVELYVWTYAGEARYFERNYKNKREVERFVGSLRVDDDPTTWEVVGLEAGLGYRVQMVVIELRAVEDITDRDTLEFEGFFADDVCVNIVIDDLD